MSSYLIISLRNPYIDDDDDNDDDDNNNTTAYRAL